MVCFLLHRLVEGVIQVHVVQVQDPYRGHREDTPRVAVGGGGTQLVVPMEQILYLQTNYDYRVIDLLAITYNCITIMHTVYIVFSSI